MLGRHVQGFEVVPVVFSLGAVEDLVALSREDRLDAGAELRQRMETPDRWRTARKGDIDAAGRAACRGQGRQTLVEHDLDVLLELVDLLAERRALLRRGRAEGFHQPGHRAALAAQVLVAQRLQVRVRADGGHVGSELGFQVGDGDTGDVQGAEVLGAECGAEVPTCRCAQVRCRRAHVRRGAACVHLGTLAPSTALGTRTQHFRTAPGTQHRARAQVRAAVRPPPTA